MCTTFATVYILSKITKNFKILFEFYKTVSYIFKPQNIYGDLKYTCLISEKCQIVFSYAHMKFYILVIKLGL